MLNFCANNYLGPRRPPGGGRGGPRRAGRLGLRDGQRAVHLRHPDPARRARSAAVGVSCGTEATILFSSCFDANGGVFEVLLDERDAVISDELNHASIIDGIRLCKARRLRYRNRDMADLETQLQVGRRRASPRSIVTDGVFSMDGYLAPLDEICAPGRALRRAGDGRRLARRRIRRAVRRGNPGTVRRAGPGRHHTPARSARRSAAHRAATSAPAPRSSSCCASGPARTCSPTRSPRRSWPDRSRRWSSSPAAASSAPQLQANAALFRQLMTDAGFDLLPGEHPIVPVMFGGDAVPPAPRASPTRCSTTACT